MRSNRSRAVFVVCSLAALASLRAVAGPQGSGRDPASRALSIFSDVLALTRANYVESTDPRILLEGAYDGMSDALDPFSFYVPASERATFQAQQASGAVNPGIVIARRGGFPYVVAPLPGSPAEKAGVQAGDLLDSVDGKSMRNAPLWKITAALEGPEGTRVDVGLFRVVDEKKVSFRLQRSKYEPAAPTAKWESDVGVIRIPAFGPATGAAVRKARGRSESPRALPADPGRARRHRRRPRGSRRPRVPLRGSRGRGQGRRAQGRGEASGHDR